MTKKGSTTRIAKRSETVARQKAAVAKMNAPLKRVYGQMRDRRVSIVHASLDYYREYGQQVEQVANDQDTYKSGAITLLSTALEVSESTLYKAAAFFRNYTDPEFAALCQLRTSTNDALTWSHVLHLLLVADKAVRLRLQTQAARQSWSSDELKEAVDEHLGTENQRPGSGRPFVKPKSVLQGLRNYCAASAEYTRRNAQVWDDVFEDALQAPPDSVDQSIVHQAQQAAKLAADLVQLSQARQTAAAALLQRYQEIVAAREQSGAK